MTVICGMTRLLRRLTNWTPVRTTRNWAKHAVVPRSEGQSLYDVSRFFIREIRENRLNVRCAAVTYNFLMAIPPSLLFLFSLVPYLPLRNVQDTILSTLRLIIPSTNTYISISTVVVDFMNNERGDILSFGILLTLFFSSNGMMGLLHSFERSVPVYIKRSNLHKRWTAIKLTVMMLMVMILTIAALIIQSQALNELILKIFDNTAVIRIVSIAIVILVMLLTISAIYTYGPKLSHKLPFISPGSVFATIFCVLTTGVFFFLVNNFINYNKVYGSIGSLMAFMVWVWLNILVILLGYELNVSILLAKTALNKNAPDERL